MSLIPRRTDSRNRQDCYRPDDKVKLYLERKLALERRRREIMLAGEELSREEDSQRRSLDTEKVKILNDYIFPSMANVVEFLEYSQEDELREAFADDIKELFFGKSSLQDGNTYPVFLRLLLAATEWKPEMIGKNKTVSEILKDPIALDETVKLTDFRLRLLGYLYEAIGLSAIFHKIKYVFDDDTFANVVRQDFARLGIWIRLLTKNADTEGFNAANVSRPVLF